MLRLRTFFLLGFITCWATLLSGCGQSPRRDAQWKLGSGIHVGPIRHETVFEFPLPRTRTTIGIGESVTCWIDSSSFKNTDIWLDSQGNQTLFADTMGTVEWTVDGDSAYVFPNTGKIVTLTAALGGSKSKVILNAFVSDSGTQFVDSPVVLHLEFQILVPTGIIKTNPMPLAPAK